MHHGRGRRCRRLRVAKTASRAICAVCVVFQTCHFSIVWPYYNVYMYACMLYVWRILSMYMYMYVYIFFSYQVVTNCRRWCVRAWRSTIIIVTLRRRKKGKCMWKMIFRPREAVRGRVLCISKPLPPWKVYVYVHMYAHTIGICARVCVCSECGSSGSGW